MSNAKQLESPLLTDAERAAVWEQVDRLTADPALNKSRRYPSLLRYLVEHALDGDLGSLKERVLGIEVFDRRPDYDTANDPIVRVTAAELRKRVGKYYENPEHGDELRVLLPTGTYVPTFQLPVSQRQQTPELEALPTAAAPHTDVAPSAVAALASHHAPDRPRSYGGWYVGGVAAAVLAGCVAFAVGKSPSEQRPNALWEPLLKSKNQVQICIANQPRGIAHLMDASNPVLPPHRFDDPPIMSADSTPAIMQVARVFGDKHPYQIREQDRVTLTDIAGGPAVLIGAYNNIWTLRMTRDLPLHFANDTDLNQMWIEDRQAPEKRDWMNLKIGSESGQQYALIARFIAPYTHQPTLVIAGLGHDSNLAAIEFVSSPEHRKEIDQLVAAQGNKPNVELVLGLSVINNHASVPQIIASRSW